MNIVFRSPGKYIQKAGAINGLPQYIKVFGGSALLTCTSGSKNRHGEKIAAICEHSDCEIETVTIGGETTLKEIDNVIDAYNNGSFDVIIGIGGGKALDTAKAASDVLCCPLIIVPTAASNDAPCSALSVIHDENGAVTELRTTKRNPDVVLVDTNILIDAPERLFVAGMGDALATWFEANACRKSGAVTLAGEQSSDIALTLSKLCYDTLINRGHSALNAVRAGLVNDDFDSVVQASIYLSGVGFESGGVAAAHAINDGFSACAEAAHLYHGEIVAFGVLSMLMLEAADSDTVDTVLNFMLDVGLPVSFKQLRIEPTDELLLRVSNTACTESVMSNMPFKVSPADVVRAMLKADLVGTSRLK